MESNKNASILTGRCLCGSVTYTCKGNPKEVEACHCTMCRRISGSPFSVFALFPEESVTFFTKDKSTNSIIEFKGMIHSETTYFRVYKSSNFASRAFCQGCGSPLVFQLDTWKEKEIQITVCTLDDPDKIPPQSHIGVESCIRWLKLADELPRYTTDEATSKVQ